MKLCLGIGLICAPVIVLLILIQVIEPLKVTPIHFKGHGHCPGSVSYLFRIQLYTYSLV